MPLKQSTSSLSTRVRGWALPMLGKYLDVFRTQPADRLPLSGIPEAQFEALRGLLYQLHREIQSGSGDSIEMRGALTWQIAILLRRLIRLEKASPQNSEVYATMLKVRSHIDRHFAEDCSLGQLCRVFYSQPSTISHARKRLFKKLTGMEGTAEKFDQFIADL